MICNIKMEERYTNNKVINTLVITIIYKKFTRKLIKINP